MDAAALLAELSAGNHPSRIQRMIELGRREAAEPAVAAAIDALEAGETPFERRLALASCFSSRNGGRVLRGLRDPSRLVRSFAERLAPLVCDDAAAFDALQVAHALRRERRMVRAFTRRGRRTALDRYVEWLADAIRDPNFCDVLPLASDATVERYLDRALERPSKVFWDRMRRYAPAVLGRLLARRLREQPGAPEADLKWLLESSFTYVAERAPEEGIAVAEALLERGITPGQGVLVRLARGAPLAYLRLFERFPVACGAARFGHPERFPIDTLRWLAAEHPGTLGSSWALLRRCDEPRRRAVAEAWFARGSQVRPAWGIALFAAPELADLPGRDEAFERWSAATQNMDGIVAHTFLRELPVELQEREARRHLHRVTQLVTRPEIRIEYARYLPFDEANEALAVYLSHPEGALRGLTIGILLDVIGRRGAADPALVDRGLALCLRRKNEQDPVRRAMLGGLAGWPRDLWKAEHCERVGRILRDALDAADLSHATATSGERLLLRVFGKDATWGATWLGVWVKERGRLTNPRLGDALTADEVRLAAPVLLDVARSWAKFERDGQLAALVQSLGPRLPLAAGMSELALDVVRATPWEGTVMSLLSVLLDHDRDKYLAALPWLLPSFRDRGFHDLVFLLLARDERPPRIVIDEARRRLRAMPKHHVIDGSLRTLRERSRPDFEEAAEELLRLDPSLIWLDVLQWHVHRFRQDLLTPFLGDRAIEGRYATGRTAWILPFTSGFFRWNAEQQALHGAAITSVLRDTERDTPTVLECVRLLPQFQSASMDALCEIADDPRPAVQECAIRVLARCDAGQGVPALLRCLGDERARVAIYGFRSAVLAMLPSRAVPILKQVPLRMVTIAKEVVRLLGELRSDEACEHLEALDRTDLHRDVRIALLRALWDHLGRDATWGIFERAATGPDWVIASRVGDVPADRLTADTDRKLSRVLTLVLDRPEPGARLDLLRRARGLSIKDPDRVFLAACRARLSSRYDDETDAAADAVAWRSTERDVDAFAASFRALVADRRAASRVVARLVLQKPRENAVLAALVRAAAEALFEEPPLVPLALRAAAAALDGPAIAERLRSLGIPSALHHGHVSLALALADAVPAHQREAFEAELREAPSDLARAAALRVFLSQTATHGWTAERRASLERYQRDPSPLVAGDAQMVFPPAEEPESPPGAPGALPPLPAGQ